MNQQLKYYKTQG